MLIRKQRIDRGIAAMREQNVDMWIALGRDVQHKGEPMLRYLLTFDMSGPVAVILTRSGKKYAINAPLETEELESMGLFDKVFVNTEGYEGIKEIIADLVRRENPQRVALNFLEKDSTPDGLSLTSYRVLTEAFQRGGVAGGVISSPKLMK